MIIAYIDPGTGSIILQIIAGGVVGTLFVIKLYWRRVKAMSARLLKFFSGRSKE